MGTPYPDQLATKQAKVLQIIGAAGIVTDDKPTEWLSPVASADEGYRNKAKMVIGGSLESPTVGILDGDGYGIDLQNCGICAPGLALAFPAISRFITIAGLVPYEINTRRGELKSVIVTVSPDDLVMVRFVLRSTESVSRIRKHLPQLVAELPNAIVVSVNFLPEHKALVEGPEELILTEATSLEMRVNEVTLSLRPQSFFQTNTEIAAALYREARTWLKISHPIDNANASALITRNQSRTVWDLYCGVGGFALHLASDKTPNLSLEVIGVEESEEAVASAAASAVALGASNVRFIAGDAENFARTAPHPPDVLVVNPPRRGIGSGFAKWINGSGIPSVLYSSCNPETLARDLETMSAYRLVRARMFDMFPQTSHVEVLTLLERR